MSTFAAGVFRDAGNGPWRCFIDHCRERPVSPYAHHYLVEALHEAGLHREAEGHMNAYWGRMVELGADTFWEVFVPEDHRSSPYGTPLLNSYCHAWSCSPVCFLRNEKHKREKGFMSFVQPLQGQGKTIFQELPPPKDRGRFRTQGAKP